MITEAEEQKLYLEVKRCFIGEKGFIVFIEVDDAVFINPKVHYLTDNMGLCTKVRDLQKRNISYAIFDYSEAVPTYFFFGHTFIQKEILETGEIIDFEKQRQKKPLDREQLKNELKMLSQMLRDTKAA